MIWRSASVLRCVMVRAICPGSADVLRRSLWIAPQIGPGCVDSSSWESVVRCDSISTRISLVRSASEAGCRSEVCPLFFLCLFFLCLCFDDIGLISWFGLSDVSSRRRGTPMVGFMSG